MPNSFLAHLHSQVSGDVSRARKKHVDTSVCQLEAENLQFSFISDERIWPTGNSPLYTDELSSEFNSGLIVFQR